MKWRAVQGDGFSARLLFFVIDGCDGIAEIEAQWRDPTRQYAKHELHTIVEIDDSMVHKIVPHLRLMNAEYDCGMDDVGVKGLKVEIDGEVIDRKVHGTGALVGSHPELRPFISFFMWLEEFVLSLRVM